MAIIVVPFKPKPMEKPETSSSKVVESHHNVCLVVSCGEWSVWVAEEQILGPVSEDQARRRFNDLRAPHTPGAASINEEKTVRTVIFEQHLCPGCGKVVSDERTALLGVVTCAECTPQQPKLMGVMVYTHKSTAELVITSNPKLLKQLKKPANKQR